MHNPRQPRALDQIANQLTDIEKLFSAKFISTLQLKKILNELAKTMDEIDPENKFHGAPKNDNDLPKNNHEHESLQKKLETKPLNEKTPLLEKSKIDDTLTTEKIIASCKKLSERFSHFQALIDIEQSKEKNKKVKVSLEPSRNYFEVIPDEMFKEITGYLSTRQKLSSMRVCKKFHKLIIKSIKDGAPIYIKNNNVENLYYIKPMELFKDLQENANQMLSVIEEEGKLKEGLSGGKVILLNPLMPLNPKEEDIGVKFLTADLLLEKNRQIQSVLSVKILGPIIFLILVSATLLLIGELMNKSILAITGSALMGASLLLFFSVMAISCRKTFINKVAVRSTTKEIDLIKEVQQLIQIRYELLALEQIDKKIEPLNNSNSLPNTVSADDLEIPLQLKVKAPKSSFWSSIDLNNAVQPDEQPKDKEENSSVIEIIEDSESPKL